MRGYARQLAVEEVNIDCHQPSYQYLASTSDFDSVMA
jgi:hypothetical protein